MKDNKTLLVFLVDRSGSMFSIQNDMNGALAALIEKQKLETGECNVSAYLFDDKYETLFENRDIQSVDKIEIKPRGNTALVDALGKTILSIGQQLNTTEESEKPSKVIFVVVTDGEENASKEYKLKDIKNSILHQQSVYKWEFLFLGANQDAITTGATYGIHASRSISYSTSSNGVTGAMLAACSGMSCLRSGASYAGFSDAERKLAVS